MLAYVGAEALVRIMASGRPMLGMPHIEIQVHPDQHVLLFTHAHRVAGVRAALTSHHQIRALGEHVDDFAFAFIAPLGTDQNCICHKTKNPVERGK